MHWTQKPENKARLKAMRKKAAAKKTAKSAPKHSRKLSLYNELAIIGARVELQRLEQKIIALKVFLKRAK